MKPIGWITVALLGCGGVGQPEPPEEVPGALVDVGDILVRGGGAVVTVREAEVLYERMGVPQTSRAQYHRTPQGQQLLSEYLVAMMLYEQALAVRRWEDAETSFQLAFAERQVLAGAQRDALAASEVTPEAIDEWKERYRSLFDKPEVHARQIVVKREDRAKELLEELQAGASFEVFVADHSIDVATKERKGDLGWFRRDEQGWMGDVVFGSTDLGLVGPIESRRGFHLVEVLNRRAATPDEEVVAQAMRDLTHSEARRMVAQMVGELELEWVTPDAN